jgi:UDP-N-acetylglucosamine 2-epimerase (non-hydrolysing)
MRKILVVVGTYSEAILMAPLVQRLREAPALQTFVHVIPAQRRTINQVLSFFGIRLDEGLAPAQQETGAHERQDIDHVIEKLRPDCVLVHGDTSAAIKSSCLYTGQTEAGLRVHELRYPRQETGRKLDLIATSHFVTSEVSRDNLLREGVAAGSIYLTGSLAVEAMLIAVERMRKDAALKAELATSFPFLDPDKRLILVIGHRREDRGGGLESVCRALKRLAMRRDVQVVYPAPLNPGARGIVEEIFADHPAIALIGPQDYLHTVYLMQAAYLILADSGATPEEVLALSKPVLVMRSVAECPEAIDAGTIKLVGTDTGRILRECTMFLDDPSYRRAFSTHRNPHADGLDSRRIVAMLQQ